MDQPPQSSYGQPQAPTKIFLARLVQIAVPTLILAGDHDRQDPLKQQRREVLARNPRSHASLCCRRMVARSRSMGSSFAEPSVFVSSTLPSTQDRAIEIFNPSQSTSLHFSPATSLTRGPKNRSTCAMVRYGSFSLLSKRLNSSMVKIRGTFVRFDEPFTRTRFIGFRSIGIISHRMAQLKSRCIMSRMRSLIHSSTASGFTSAIGLSLHFGLMWQLIQLKYRERVTSLSGNASRMYRSATAPNEVWSAD